MELNLSLHDLGSTISDTTYDSDSTASNSIIEEYVGNKLGVANRQQANTISAITVSGSSNIQIGDRVVYNGPVTIRQEFSAKSNVTLKSPTESPVNDKKNIPKRFLKWKILFVISLIIFTIILLLILMLSLNYKANVNQSVIQSNSSSTHQVKLYSRSDWGALDPDGPVDLLVLPLSRVIVCHTVTKNCFTKDMCVQNMREIERLHMNRRYYRIGYNFVICNDGNVYEGIGWDKEGAHTYGQNLKSFGIAFNGNYNFELPNRNQIAAFFSLLELGVKLGKLTPDYKIFGASQFKETESPGKALYQMIVTWDHWSEEI